MTNHTHPKTDEMFVWWIPAHPDTPMELKLIPNTLEALQSYVGGYIERVFTRRMPALPCRCGTIMLVNEEGLMRRLPYNSRATEFYYPHSPGIMGDAILLGEGIVQPDKMSHSYDPEDGPDTDFFSLPINFHTWAGPGTPVPPGAQAWEA